MRRHWPRFQFRLATLLLAVTSIGIGLGILANSAHRQRDAVQAIKKCGGRVRYDFEQSELPQTGWRPRLRDRLGDDYAGTVTYVAIIPDNETWHRKHYDANGDHRTSVGVMGITNFMFGAAVDDGILRSVARLSDLRGLDISLTDIGDTGMAYIRGLKRLQSLWLGCTPVTDDGIANVRGLRNLERLSLYGTKLTDRGLATLTGLSNLSELELGDCHEITDSGLAHVGALANLRELSLFRTRISDDGIVHLARLTNLRILSLKRTRVTDAGLHYLSRLENLTVLLLDQCGVTDRGIAHLGRLGSLKQLSLMGTSVTDAATPELSQLSGLDWLDVGETRITEAGFQALTDALPKCRVIRSSRLHPGIQPNPDTIAIKPCHGGSATHPDD